MNLTPQPIINAPINPFIFRRSWWTIIAPIEHYGWFIIFCCFESSKKKMRLENGHFSWDSVLWAFIYFWMNDGNATFRLLWPSVNFDTDFFLQKISINTLLGAIIHYSRHFYLICVKVKRNALKYFIQLHELYGLLKQF